MCKKMLLLLMRRLNVRIVIHFCSHAVVLRRPSKVISDNAVLSYI